MTAQEEIRNKQTFVDYETIAHWAKHAERPFFKRVYEHLNKLNKEKVKYTVEWLGNLDMIVKSEKGTKEFQYKSQED